MRSYGLNRRLGFTLTELLVVLAIIGTLVGLGVLQCTERAKPLR